jgi:hypothetical protein
MSHPLFEQVATENEMTKPSVDEVMRLADHLGRANWDRNRLAIPAARDNLESVIRSLSVDAAQPASEPVICVCQIDDGMVREWVQKARAVAESKGYKFAAQPQVEPTDAVQSMGCSYE